MAAWEWKKGIKKKGRGIYRLDGIAMEGKSEISGITRAGKGFKGYKNLKYSCQILFIKISSYDSIIIQSKGMNHSIYL